MLAYAIFIFPYFWKLFACLLIENIVYFTSNQYHSSIMEPIQINAYVLA